MWEKLYLGLRKQQNISRQIVAADRAASVDVTGSTGKAPAPSDRKVAPAGTQLQMLRRQRRLMNPLDETLLDTAGLQRRVGQLVDMAASVSALEIFADRQPVDFGLTAVVELWLGPNQTLPAKSGDDLTRYAWTSDPSSPQWLSAVQVSEQDRAEKAVYAWRLKAGGQTLDVQIPSDASLNRLKRLVQSKLQKPVASLARRSGRPLPELGSVAAEGLEDGEELTVVLQQHDRLCSHPDGLCFSAIRRNGTVKFWGNALCEVCGGPPDFPPRTELFHVQKIVAAQNAFAAIRTDGRVVTWGECCAGGETSPAVAEQLVEVQEISATSKAFAAIRSDGSVVTWGFAYLGGNSSAVQLELVDVKEIVGSPFAFAAIRADGAVVTWGTPNRGGDSSAVADQLRKDVISVVASNLAFTALKADGTVVSWGDPLRGGNSQDVQKDLKGVKLIRPCNAAFAALRHDGLVVTWGDPERGGNSSPVQCRLHDVIDIQATKGAFAALRADGRVIAWGDSSCGGDSCTVNDELWAVSQICSSSKVFSAIRENGDVIIWGDGPGPMIMPGRCFQLGLKDVRQVVSCSEAFAALHSHGKVTTWSRMGKFQLSEPEDIEEIRASSGAFAAISSDGSLHAWGDPAAGGSLDVAWLKYVTAVWCCKMVGGHKSWTPDLDGPFEAPAGDARMTGAANPGPEVEVKSSDASPVKTAEDNANADMEFYKDEWIPVILPHDQDASTPSPVEIARLFQEVDHIIRGKKIGRDVDLANLEKAAASLGTALCADLARALEADTCEAIQGAIKRGRGADLPKRLVAMKRLCELQLHRALATGDEADLTMALREASRLGGDDAANFKNFAAVKQKLAHLRMKRLQQQSLDVIKGDGKDLDSVMAVINVALRRSDWDRDWDQIWLEVLQEGRAQVKKMIDTAKASGQHEKVAQIFRLADKYGLRVIAAHAVSVWEDTIQAHRQDMKVLLQLCSAANMWGCKSFLSDAQEPLLTQVAELEKKWDKGGAPLARQQFKTLDKEISKLFEKVPTSLKDQIQERHDNAEAREKRLLDEAGKVIQRAESLQGAKPSRTPFKKDKKASELEMEVIQNVMGAMHEAKEWGWKKVMQKGERLLVKQVQTVLEEHELKQASPKLEEMLKAAQQHQVRESFTPILDNCLQVTKEDKKGDECLEAIKLMHLASMAEKLMLSDLRIKAVEEMKIEIEKMKSKEGAEGETQLLGFQDEAQALGDSLAVELATASLAHIEERERKKKEELQQMLQAEERLELIDADPEKTVKCVMVAEESGWKELSKQAIELYKRRVKEAKEMSVAKSNDEAIHGFRFMVRVMHSAQSMRGAVHSRIAVSAKKQVEEMMVKGSALQMFRALAWCTDVEDVHKKVQDLLTKIMKEWEENSEAAPQDVSNLHASVVELSKMSKDLKTYSQQMQRLMTADKDMLAAIKDSEDHPTDVAKVAHPRWG
ncbi:unnamed protein product [Cladocopium goreaui]|uniref:E3 ubiquitin-protein ligase HERC2 n=1 Tax=Cladocopium goreaui TaxID=2562237 RepID=A0A9P1M3W1_9DINO|nr:unnamed protein product [Cladocopium goreaui]